MASAGDPLDVMTDDLAVVAGRDAFITDPDGVTLVNNVTAVVEQVDGNSTGGDLAVTTEDGNLIEWLERAAGFTASLAPKKKKSRRKK